MSTVINIQEPSPPPKNGGVSLHDMLELGFRPLYLCGALWAIVGVGVWVFAPQWLPGVLHGLFWHAHEMLWGFVGAIAVGFLLTAVNNWTGINPLHGPALGLLALLWVLARACFLIPGAWAFLAACTAELVFFAAATIAISRSVLRSKSHHNYGIPLLLLGMGLADAGFLWAVWQHADYALLMQQWFTGMLLMLVIALLLARRVIPFFASRALAPLTLSRHTRSGQWQVGIAVLAIVTWRLDLPAVAALLFAAAGLITLWHFIAWKPWAVLRTPLLWILYLGYLGLGVGLWTTALYVQGTIALLSWPVHMIAVAGYAPLIIGMMTRTALGHTGRMLRTDRIMCTSFILLLPCIASRLVALHTTGNALPWLHASATCWVLAFLLYLYRFLPILTQPRADKQPGRPIDLKRT